MLVQVLSLDGEPLHYLIFEKPCIYIAIENYNLKIIIKDSISLVHFFLSSRNMEADNLTWGLTS